MAPSYKILPSAKKAAKLTSPAVVLDMEPSRPIKVYKVISRPRKMYKAHIRSAMYAIEEAMTFVLLLMVGIFFTAVLQQQTNYSAWKCTMKNSPSSLNSYDAHHVDPQLVDLWVTETIESTDNMEDDGKQTENFFKKMFPLFRVNRTQEEDKHPKLLRVRRDAYAGDFEEDMLPSSCQVPPNGLKNAEILCKKWPKSITCKSYCAYGTTFSEGIVRTHFCSYEKSIWSAKFEECKSFVDCKPKMITPGKIKCIGNSLTESPTCEIECDSYDDKEALQNQTYSCKSDGTWQPALPFCVGLKDPLVQAPQITEHTSISYPQKQGME